MINATHARLTFAACLALAGFAGCEKSSIQVQIVPKDSLYESNPPGVEGEEVPQLTWTLPGGWEQTKPGQMSLATFIAGDGNATMSITPLPSLAGREEQVVNMWREQVELGPLSAEEMKQALQPIDIAGEKGSTFEILGSRAGKPSRTLTAMLHRGNQSWFFKLSGDDAAVTAQREAFASFVKSVKFIDAPAAAGAANTGMPAMSPSGAPSAPASADVANAAKSQWKPPESWQILQPGAMQVAKFAVPEKDGAKAEVSISIFPNDTGGTLANVNRWRQQIGLGEVDDAGLKDSVKPIDTIPGAVLVDIANEQRAILGAIVPRDGQYVFYKMLGDTPAVGAARQDFIAFAQAKP